MAMPAKDLTGQKFGYLTAVARAGSSDGVNRKALWLCRCECGTEVIRESQYLRTKHRTQPRSCGCHHGNQTHSMSRTRPYRIWSNMRGRCLDEADKDWANYGGRGITVCDAWRDSFQRFWDDMQEGYDCALTLGRVENDGPYSPGNCRWETPIQQSNNRRSNTVVATPLGTMTMSEAARAYGIKPVTLYARVGRYGWPLEKALLTPVSMTSSTAARETDS